MQLMNDRKSLQTVGNRRTWLVRRFRVAAEGIADDEVAPADEPDVAEDSPDQSEQTDKAAEGEGGPPRPRKRRLIKLVRAIAAGILAAVLATAGYEGWLLFEQHQKDGAAPAPQLDRSRVKMTMEKVDGRWLASKVELP